MSIIPPYTGVLQRIKLDGERRKVYVLAKQLGEITHNDLAELFSQTAGNWFNRLSELTLSGMLVVAQGEVKLNTLTGVHQQVYRPTQRIKPLLLCMASDLTIAELRSYLKPLFVNHQPLLTVVNTFLTPRVVGSVDGALLRQRYENGDEPNLIHIEGWQVIWTF